MEYVALYTFLSFDEIAALRTAHEDDPSRRIAHRRLAWEVVRFVHGEAAADQAAEAARALFEGGRAEAGAPVVTLERAAFGDGIDVIDLALAAGLARSRSEARRLIAQGGLYVDGRRALEGQRVSQADLTDGHLTLRRGKRDWVVVRLNDAN